MGMPVKYLLQCCNQRLREELTALGLLWQMPRRVCQPGVISCDVTVRAFQKGMQWENALRLLQWIPYRALLLSADSFTSAVEAANLFSRQEVWDETNDSTMHSVVYRIVLSCMWCASNSRMQT